MRGRETVWPELAFRLMRTFMPRFFLPAFPPEPVIKGPAITADILGLADIDQLENRIPVRAVAEVFDPRLFIA